MYDEGSLVTINATANIGYKFKKWNDGNTDNPRVITVTENAIYVAYFEDDKNWNAGHEYVDLGLPSGLKWATCNIGAEKPEDYGDYFAWGEIKSKESYAWGSYKYRYKYSYSHGWWTVTKYCTDEEFGKDGFKDNKTELDPEDDVATVNWGKTWRMPTKAEQDELHYNCVWICMAENGVNGCKVIGPNGNSIFLPAAGYMNDTSLEYVGSDGYYWSSSLTQFPDEAYYVGFGSDGVKSDTDSPRSKGLLIRPVCQ